MPKSYTDFLKEQGASDDEIKVLVTPKSESVYAKMVAEQEAATRQATEAQSKLTQYDEWYNKEAAPAYQSALNEAASARARAAGLEEQLKAAREYGLAPKEDPQAPPPKKDEPVTFDASKYVQNDTLQKVAEEVGDNWATMADIMQEHHRLFGSDVPMTDLRREAIAQKKHIKQVWADKYQVAAKRDELQKKAESDREAAIRADERQKARSEFGNPMTAPLAPSVAPFTKKPSDPASAPWMKNQSEEQLSNDRVTRAMKNVPVQ